MEESLESELSDIRYLMDHLLQIKVEKILITETLKKKHRLKQSPYFEIRTDNKNNV